MLASRVRVQARPARGPACPRRTSVLVKAAATTEMPRWPIVFAKLTSAKVESISPEEAQKRVNSGEWLLVDVRLAEQHESGAPAGAVSVPIYETITMEGADFRKMLKAVMYKSNGVNPVDPNPKFSEQLKAAVAKAGAKGVITVCEAGGTLKPSTNFPEGKPSRSLQAAYRVLTENLASSVAHLERGVYGWYQAELPMKGEYKPDIGRTPMAAAEPTLQRVNQERGFDMRPEDKPVEAASKKWPW
ncbi:hypothetical protein HYH02_005936 [Chlamydomonas schloesseri]|uniref:Rhodanese domain-containing protein n=1 Tax=Chlamydomonas schloesseri TaxID=2026947 RepID=A0A835WK60_9CHLO|nr:hypothetical protein HYH02_005936 [Chlamydomonas schloesseri]|eukprot:KAG2449189.1 hypothetical protein HYH02_005936 [Chlamydomonas schloesseri]